MVKTIRERPLGGAFSVSDTFASYRFGIVSRGSHICEHQDNRDINHAMAIVGYDEDGSG